MSCGKCSAELPSDSDFAHCTGCNLDLHYTCAGTLKKSYAAKSFDKSKFKCAGCKRGDTPPPGKFFSFDQLKELVAELKGEICEDIKKEIRDTVKELREETAAEIKELKETVSELRRVNTEKDTVIANLVVQVNGLDQYSRKNNFEIDNIEQFEDESIEDIVLKIAGHMKIDLKREEIDAAHRLPQRKNTGPAKIIVQLTSRKKRDEFVRARSQAAPITSTKLVGGNIKSRIYINENLSPFFRELLWKSKIRAKAAGYKFIWYSFGKVLVRKDVTDSKVFKIFDFDDIEKIPGCLSNTTL